MLMRALFLFWLLILPWAPAWAQQSPLRDHPAPYLAMHAGDPVNWRLWSTDILQKARRQNKLIFVSVGYFSCHWCHVMQKESYQNPKIAALINRLAIAVKVDRELQPALDSALMNFVEKTRGQGGWPLNVFLTPQGDPLVGFVYLPPQQFEQFLVNLQTQWEQQQTQLSTTAREASQYLSPTKKPSPVIVNRDNARRLNSRWVDQVLSQMDEMSGGFGQQGKFPLPPILYALVCEHKRNPNENIEAFLRLTLTQMGTRGLHDHLQGGFFRYTTDPTWQTPHFEKMLYDNAQLAHLYLVASKVLDDTYFRQMALRTFNFILKAFEAGNGAYFASLSALDGHGVEGGYYLYAASELKKKLPPALLQHTMAAWQLDQPGFDHGALPLPIMDPEELAKRLGVGPRRAIQLQQRGGRGLLQIRLHRQLPVDDKILTGWNSLWLASLSKAARLTGSNPYRLAAKKLRDYLVANHWRRDRVLSLGKKTAESNGEVNLQDYAYLSKALTEYARLSGADRDRRLAADIAIAAWKRFYNNNGWLQAQGYTLHWLKPQAVISDGPMPSPSSQLIQTSLMLSEGGREPRLRRLALGALAIGDEALSNEPFWYASHIKTMMDVTHESADFCRY